MPKSISNRNSEVRCNKCDKLLATSEGIKCPRCKKVHSPEEHFAHELCEGQYIVVFLWAPDGRHASSIVIRKEIWLNIGTPPRKGIPKSCIQYPVFFVYNYLDPSQAFAPDTGCRVNEEPTLDFNSALKLAKQHEHKARNSGKWVEAEDVKDPPPKKHENGCWDFRDLQTISRRGQVSFEDLYDTLEWYSDGSGISAQVVIEIINTINPDLQPLTLLRNLTGRGLTRINGKSKEEWRILFDWLAKRT